jgi:hypothetical protein
MRSDPLALWEDIRLSRSSSPTVSKAHDSRCCEEVCIIAVILCVDGCFGCEKKCEQRRATLNCSVEVYQRFQFTTIQTINHDFFLKETVALAYVSFGRARRGSSESSSLGAAFLVLVFSPGHPEVEPMGYIIKTYLSHLVLALVN